MQWEGQQWEEQQWEGQQWDESLLGTQHGQERVGQEDPGVVAKLECVSSKGVELQKKVGAIAASVGVIDGGRTQIEEDQTLGKKSQRDL